ncbi:MAG: ABC transporter substrate-binding protein [Pseudomonadales bacterium]|nr:ABC transporter substrate-binding protein [Pseudomonadales bacterium]
MFPRSPAVPRGLRGAPATLGLGALVALFLLPLAALAAEPDEVVRTVSEDILGIIAEHRDSYDGNPDAYYEAMDARMAEFVDYDAIARAVMNQYWDDATPEQRERFVATFRRSLVRSYARALMEFEHEEIDVLPVLDEHRRGNRALVRMAITGTNGRSYELRYSMAESPEGAWQVRNVIVDGVNLGVTYRNQFASAMQSPDGGTIDAVIDSWTVSDAEVSVGS